MSKTDCFDTESLSLYSVGQGSDKWRRDVAAHVTDCPACKRELAALEAVAGVLDRTPKCEAPDQWGSIAARLEPRKPGWLAWPVLARPQTLATALGLALVIALAGLHTWNSPTTKPSVTKQVTKHTEASDSELAQSHMALAWNDPFSDSASLAVMASGENRSRGK